MMMGLLGLHELKMTTTLALIKQGIQERLKLYEETMLC